MRLIRRLANIFSALRALGLRPAFHFALYRLGILSGYYRLKTPIGGKDEHLIGDGIVFNALPAYLPTREAVLTVAASNQEILRAQAEDIFNDRFSPFGGPTQPLVLTPPGAPIHWSQVNDFDENRTDLKDIWEPARFGWAVILARAYYLFEDERYSEKFRQLFEVFQKDNPVNQGPNWSSAQEVSLRFISLAICFRIFNEPPSKIPAPQQKILVSALLQHVRRIPITLQYAIAQNNNHLLSEACALFTAGVLFRDQPESAQWRKKGWEWFSQGLLDQIEPDGVYCQHSTNYHRLMLHLALWMNMVARQEDLEFSPAVRSRLKAAVHWLSALTDPLSGRASNLGHNDGSNILPMACVMDDDYRPVQQAAGRAFLGEDLFPPGPWDELSLWLGLSEPDQPLHHPVTLDSPAVARIHTDHNWGTLRAVNYRSRPAHADQLHVDLWWNGENMALDAGTYRYTAPDPWLNSLAGTAVHNTLIMDEIDQMERGGRFLWLNWAEASLVTPDKTSDLPSDRQVTACLKDYHHTGLRHTRSLAAMDAEHWSVHDRVDAANGERKEHTFRLHWLLPDWNWAFDNDTLEIKKKNRVAAIRIQSNPELLAFSLVRAGETLYGEILNSPLLGWCSPTYGVKIPCLSFSAVIRAKPPIEMVTSWQFSVVESESGTI